MATKSKSKASIVWSIIALVIAFMSIVYCFSAIFVIAESGWEHSAELFSHIARIVGGKIG